MSVSDRLKNFDQGSVSKEFRVYTVSGAIISVITILFIAYLAVTEIYFNFQIVLHELVHVNATSPRGLEIEFDISFSDLSCSHVSIDAADPSGQPQSLHLDTTHHVWKHRFKMSDDGKHRVLIGSKEQLELGSTMLAEEDLEEQLYEKMADDDLTLKAGEEEKENTEACGSCYGAGEEDECCDTCEDVRRVYRRRGWVLPNLDDIKQCKNEQKKNSREGAGEGCNVHGVVALSSGGGNLHLAPGQDWHNAGGAAVTGNDIFQMLLQQFQMWNVSHTVNKIRFGPDYPSAIYQLDNQQRMVEDTSAMYQYYFQVSIYLLLKGELQYYFSTLFTRKKYNKQRSQRFCRMSPLTTIFLFHFKIVPTLYRFRNGTTIQTYQYSVTEHIRRLSPGSSRGLPGVFFFYEVSPLHVEIKEGYRKGWIAFFTSVCAIIGGVITCMTMLDQYLFAHKGKRRDSLAL